MIDLDHDVSVEAVETKYDFIKTDLVAKFDSGIAVGSHPLHLDSQRESIVSVGDDARGRPRKH